LSRLHSGYLLVLIYRLNVLEFIGNLSPTQQRAFIEDLKRNKYGQELGRIHYPLGVIMGIYPQTPKTPTEIKEEYTTQYYTEHPDVVKTAIGAEVRTPITKEEQAKAQIGYWRAQTKATEEGVKQREKEFEWKKEWQQQQLKTQRLALGLDILSKIMTTAMAAATRTLDPEVANQFHNISIEIAVSALNLLAQLGVKIDKSTVDNVIKLAIGATAETLNTEPELLAFVQWLQKNHPDVVRTLYKAGRIRTLFRTAGSEAQQLVGALMLNKEWLRSPWLKPYVEEFRATLEQQGITPEQKARVDRYLGNVEQPQTTQTLTTTPTTTTTTTTEEWQIPENYVP